MLHFNKASKSKTEIIKAKNLKSLIQSGLRIITFLNISFMRSPQMLFLGRATNSLVRLILSSKPVSECVNRLSFVYIDVMH